MAPRTPRDEQTDLVANLITISCALHNQHYDLAIEMVVKLMNQQSEKLTKMVELETDMQRCGL